MIPRSALRATPPATPAPELPPWRRSLAEAVSSVGELLELLELGPEHLAPGRRAARGFPLRVPRGFVARMRKGDPRDPLLLQVLPASEELRSEPGFTRDPLGEEGASPVAGVLHKYRGRALLVVTGACAVHCRYCFRRHFPYGEHAPWSEGWTEALAYLAGETSIEEVILSGGDPLALPDEKLEGLVLALADLPHLERLRLHTRLPVVLPERVDTRFLAWLTGTRLRPVVVLHANHPAEIDRGVQAACDRLREAGVPLLNQAVLLAGVNDSVEALRGLSRSLFDAGVLPYYLHLLDPVQGAAHFEVDEPTARRLHRELTESLPGYLVPKLVKEVQGERTKRAIR